MFDAEKLSLEIKTVADDIFLGRFHNRRNLDVREKTKNNADFVTAADMAMDAALASLLKAHVNAPILSEETTPDPFTPPEGLKQQPWLWVVDPLDGTSSFIDGTDKYCTMVALLRNGDPVFSCIYAPAKAILAVAEKNSGAQINGQVGIIGSDKKHVDQLSGIIPRSIMPPHIERSILDGRARLGFWQHTHSCGIDYIDIAREQLDFALYMRSFIWDHVAGVLLVREARGTAETWQYQSTYNVFNPMAGILASSPSIFADVIKHFNLQAKSADTTAYMNEYLKSKSAEHRQSLTKPAFRVMVRPN